MAMGVEGGVNGDSDVGREIKEMKEWVAVMVVVAKRKKK